LVFLLLSVTFIFCSCTNQEEKGEGEMNGQKIFTTPEEAAVKAKSDLIQVLEENKELDLGIDVTRLRESELTGLVRYVEVDFGKILTTKSVRSLSEIVAYKKSMIAPFVLKSYVVGIAEVGEVKEGWKVIGLGNKALTEDLNVTRVALDKGAEVTVYEVPNLQIFIYGVKKNASETYYLNFGKYLLRDSVAVSDFYPAVRESSIRFQKEFGDQLKKKKLVK
jgi:hypothetical protein